MTMDRSSFLRPAPYVAAIMMALVWGAAGCDGGGGSGGSGGNGSGASGGGAAGGAGPGCGDGCQPGEVCVDDACQPIPDSCPCPVGTYCNTAENVCVLGCQTNEHCGSGTVCDAATASCVAGCQSDEECKANEICKASVCQEGCHENADCPEGSVCVSEYCQEGCATTADCKVPGTECINGSCGCPGGQIVCDGACTPIDTTQNCGGCGVVCDPGATCEVSGCTCAPGVCEPGLVGETGLDNYFKMVVAGDFIYWSQLDAKILRMPKAGGATTEVISDTKISGFHVAGANVLYTTLVDGNTFEYRLKKVPIAGGAATQLDTGVDGTARVGEYNSYAIWSRSNSMRSVPVAGGSSTLLVNGYRPATDIAANAQGIFWAAPTGNGFDVVRFQMGDFDILHTWAASGNAPFLVADTEHVYFDKMGTMCRVPVAGGALEELAPNQKGPAWLALDGTHLYWVDQFATGDIKRLPKGGGAEEVLLTLNTYPHSVQLDDQFFYWGDASGKIWKLAK